MSLTRTQILYNNYHRLLRLYMYLKLMNPKRFSDLSCSLSVIIEGSFRNDETWESSRDSARFRRICSRTKRVGRARRRRTSRGGTLTVDGAPGGDLFSLTNEIPKERTSWRAGTDSRPGKEYADFVRSRLENRTASTLNIESGSNGSLRRVWPFRIFPTDRGYRCDEKMRIKI